MNIIVGLGNPGEKYDMTRHNIGFMVVDAIAKSCGKEFKLQKKLDALTCKVRWNDDVYLLCKPQTFMNLSGKSVKKVIGYTNSTIEDIVVVYDDKDMDFGKIRFREIGSSGGHNGIKSMIADLVTQEFKRIKCGVKNPLLQYMDTADFVLANFTEEERDQLSDYILEILSKIQSQV